MNKEWCLVFYLLMLLGVWFLLFLRARMRQNLVKSASTFYEGTDYIKERQIASKGARWLFRDAIQVRLIKKYLKQLPLDVQEEYIRYKYLSNGVIVFIILFVLAVFFAYRICPI